jgi:2-methylcitrate dehydratase
VQAAGTSSLRSLLRRGFHPLSAAAFVAPLVAAKILGLSVDAAAHAVGISASRGLTMFVVNKGDISMMKAMGHAWSCADGLLAARLAARGFTGPAETLDWVAHALQPSQARLDIDLQPSMYRMPFVGIKRFPVQYEIQAAAEAAVALHRRSTGKIGRIMRVEVRTTKQALARVATPDRYRPGTREAADHSLPVCVAMALLTGDISAAHFNDGMWQRPDVLDLARRIECRAEPGRTSHSRGASVSAQFDDGHMDVETITIPEGDAARPMSTVDIEAKFISLAAASVGEQRAVRIIELIGALQEIESVSTFTRLLQVEEN